MANETASEPEVQTRIETLGSGAPKRSASVRSLARFVANSECRLATLGLATRVDFDRLLEGTQFSAPFGQSPFAFRRGIRFEERLRANGHAPLLGLLHDHLDYSISDARIANLREGFSASREGMEERALLTQELIAKVVLEDFSAPNLIDGAVFARDVGGIRSYFEADAVAARFDGPIHVGEIKSFPTVDGQADPENVSAAISQAAIYIVLLRETVTRVSGDPNIVSQEALLITPKNTGLQPTMSIKSVGRAVDRAERILSAVPAAEEVLKELPSDLPAFAKVASKDTPEKERVETARALIDHVGNSYRPECLAACGLSRLCRERAYEAGQPCRTGAGLTRLLPQISSIDRAHDLAHGAKGETNELAVAEQLTRAKRLYDVVANDVTGPWRQTK